jgi:hypothetical protein
MPKPTLQNRRYFKNVLKRYRDKFTSPIQTCQLSDIDAIFTTKSSGLTDQQINVLLFGGDTYHPAVDITSAATHGKLHYIPALAGDYINLKINSNTYQLYFNGDDSGVTYNNQTYGLNQTFTLGSKFFTVKALGGALLESQNAPTYTITPSATSVNEGNTVTFSVSTTDVPNNTTLYYSITGTVSASDFNDNTLSGSFVINNNSGTVSKTITNDLSLNNTEGTENFTLQVRTASVSGNIVATSSSITISDTSFASYSISANPTVIEGNSITFTVTTSGVPDNTTLYWTAAGAASTTADLVATSGNFAINANTGTFSVTAKEDLIVDNAEPFQVNIRTASVSGSIVATSSTVNITDTPFTITITPSQTTIVESTKTTPSNITFNFATSGVANGTVLTIKIIQVSGTVLFADTYYGGIYGSLNNVGDFSTQNYNVTVTNNVATLTLTLNRDGRTEGTDVFKLNVLNSNNTVIASSPNVTITDASFIGSRKTDKTFGPIRVNRDNGGAGQASDWYTICGLDKLPDGSKVALFIDNSGSMTEYTVAASKALLLNKLQERNMDVIVVTNPNEDWITPFNTILDD